MIVFDGIVNQRPVDEKDGRTDVTVIAVVFMEGRPQVWLQWRSLTSVQYRSDFYCVREMSYSGVLRCLWW